MITNTKNIILDDSGKLTRLILGAGMTKAEIARELEVSFNTVYRWMSRGVKPHPAQSRRIDTLFKKHVDMVPVIEVFVKKVNKDFPAVLRKDEKIRSKFLLDQICNFEDIEGNHKTVKDIKSILDGDSIKGKKLFEIMEVVNLKNALLYVINTVSPELKITEEYALDLRSIITYNSDKRSMDKIPGKMKPLLKGINQYGKQPIMKIAKDHCELRSLKPFLDDNGRVGRLIMLAQLLSKGYPPAVIKIEDKDKYNKALSKRDAENYKLMSHIICDAIQNGLKFFQ